MVVGVGALLWQQAKASLVCLLKRNRKVLRITADLWFQVSLLTFGSRFPLIAADLWFQISLLTVGSSALRGAYT